MIFKYNELEKFFLELKDLAPTKTFKDWKDGDKAFLMRHDVDFDIELAYEMALIEKNCGIVSTFFILTTCESYNVLSKHNSTLLQKIVAMGHEVGLHFDPTLYPGEFLGNAATKEAWILAHATKQDVRSVSLHNPSVYNEFPLFDNFHNAYDPRVFNDDTYIADSRMVFRNKNPFNWLQKVKENTVQILLHPMHYSVEGYGYDNILCNSLIKYIKRVDAGFRVNSSYVKDMGENIFEKLQDMISVPDPLLNKA
jgi:hypothetical protein